MKTDRDRPQPHRFLLQIAWIAAVACVSCDPAVGQELPTAAAADTPHWDAVLATLERRGGEIREAYGQSVVSIACVSRKSRSAGGLDALRGRAGLAAGLSPQDPSYIAASYATGLVWDDRGTIITVYSGLGDPNEHDYYLWNRGRVARGELSGHRAQVIAGEPYTNLAALRCDEEQFASELKPIREVSEFLTGREDTSAAAARPSAGQWVFRLACAGPASRDGWLAVEHGSVSNVRRSLPSGAVRDPAADRSLIYSHASLFQTTHVAYRDTVAAAMVDLRGTFIGVQVDEREISGEAATFGIPVSGAFERVADELAEGRVAGFGFLGIQPGRVTRKEHGRPAGVAIDDIVQGMPADVAGLRPGEVIVSVGGREVEQREAIFREVAAHQPGEEVELTVERPGRPAQKRTVRVRLTKRYLLTERPSLTANPEPSWRGTTVDAATAMPPELLFAQMRAFGGFSPTQVVAVDVELDSSAWSAGVRGGMKILAVDGMVLTSVEHFDRLTSDAARTYRLTLQLPGGQRVDATVPGRQSSTP